MRIHFRWILTGIGTMLVICVVFGAAMMPLWNALMPQLFGLPQIDFLQAAGLLIMARLLFGGIGGGWHGGGRGLRRDGHPFHHGNKLREKWMNMSEDERKGFMEKEKEFFDFHRRCPPPHGPFPPPHDPFHNDEKEKKGDGNE